MIDKVKVDALPDKIGWMGLKEAKLLVRGANHHLAAAAG
jgi:hypothetical protein